MDEQDVTRQKRRGIPLWKSSLMCFLSALAVFLVWLFYPIKPPKNSIRRQLPISAGASIEIHNPQLLWNDLKSSAYYHNLKKYPFWGSLEELYKDETNSSLGADMAQVVRDVDSVVEQVVGVRNCTAIAVGVLEQDDDLLNITTNPSYVAIAEVDNLGLTMLEIGLLFFGKKSQEFGLRYIPIKVDHDLMFYISKGSGLRDIAIASDISVLRRIVKLNSATPSVESLFANIGGIEGTFYIPEYESLSLESGKIDYRIYGVEFWANGVFFLKDQDPTKEPLAPILVSKKGTKGLSLTLTMPKSLLHDIASYLPQGSNLHEKEARSFFTDSLLKYMSGSFLDVLIEGEGAFPIYEFFWGVTDVKKSAEEAFSGAKRWKDNAAKNESDILAKLAIGAVNLAKLDNVYSVRFPLLPSMFWSTETNPDYLSLRLSLKNLFKPERLNSEEGREGYLQLRWHHSESILKLARVESTFWSLIRQVVSPEVLHNRHVLINFLDSTEDFTLILDMMRQSTDAQSLQLNISIDGSIRAINFEK